MPAARALMPEKPGYTEMTTPVVPVRTAVAMNMLRHSFIIENSPEFCARGDSAADSDFAVPPNSLRIVPKESNSARVASTVNMRTPVMRL